MATSFWLLIEFVCIIKKALWIGFSPLNILLPPANCNNKFCESIEVAINCELFVEKSEEKKVCFKREIKNVSTSFGYPLRWQYVHVACEQSPPLAYR